jgi:hypothetical protein
MISRGIGTLLLLNKGQETTKDKVVFILPFDDTFWKEKNLYSFSPSIN